MYKPLLSICIPTYNRSDVLSKCIESIVNSSVFFNDDIEIVISDNFSNDETENIVKSYQSKYKRIVYHKNEKNIGGEANFIKVIDIANGKFRKLHNDYSIFTPEGLSDLYNIVKENYSNKTLVFFSNNNILDIDKCCVSDLNVFLRTVQWNASWIGCYGFWEEDWFALDDKDRYASLNFQQIDWFLRLFEQKKRCSIYNNLLSVRSSFNASQGGYNFVKVHLEYFIEIFKPYLKKGLLKQSSISFVKRKMLFTMLGWYIRLKNNRENKFSYNNNYSLMIIIKNYWYYWWFYYDIIKKIFEMLKKRKTIQS